MAILSDDEQASLNHVNEVMNKLGASSVTMKPFNKLTYVCQYSMASCVPVEEVLIGSGEE